METRQLQLSDLNEIEELARPIYYPILWEPIEAFSRRVELYPQGGLVAVQNNQIIGYVYSHPWKWDSFVPLGEIIKLPTDPDCYYIHDLAVHVNYRGLSVGKMLAEKVLEIANFDRIKLISVLDSHHFWEKFGFKIIEPILYAPNVPGYIMKRGN